MAIEQHIYLSVDAVVFGKDAEGKYHVLLIERKNPPHGWALPGGFVDDGESAEEAMVRELEEETCLVLNGLQQFHTFSAPARDPRMRVVSIAYYTVIDKASVQPKAADDAKAVKWFQLDELPLLAFDHDEVIAMAIERANII